MNFRALLIVLTPIVVSGILSSYLIVSSTAERLHSQANQFGQSITDHMAISVSDHLLSNDRLSLNVLLSKLLDSDNFSFASVYNTQNALLVQVGKRNLASQIFTKEVTSQNVITGYVRLGFNQNIIFSQIQYALLLSLGLHALLAAVILFFGYVYGDLIYFWAMPDQSRRNATQDESSAEIPESDLEKLDAEVEAEVDGPEAIILAIKIRPSRLRLTYESQIKAALALYGGELELTENGDIMICFLKPSQLFQAICAGLLILAIFRRIKAPITVKVGIHRLKDRHIAGDLEKAKKHTSYLASISENKLLTSHLLYELIKQSPDYRVDAFHGSMAPDGQVFCINALSNQALIESQAKQIY